MVHLRADFAAAWQDQDPQQLLENMEGETYRALEARRTFRFELNGKGFFAKVHGGVGWLEIIENLIRLRAPVLGARNEWEALKRLHDIGVATMTPVAFGESGWNPATRRSFLVTEELKDMVTLEDFCKTWRNNPPPFKLKRSMISKLAQISHHIHDSGINHRDYYLCHFMMDKLRIYDPENLKFYLIDLHRAQLRRVTPIRWIIKDLSGLYYSAMDVGITKRDLYRFIKVYTALPLRKALIQYDSIWSATAKKADKLYQRMARKLETSST